MSESIEGQREPYYCPNKKCNTQVGWIYTLANGLKLYDPGGGAMAEHFEGPCKECGTFLHFHIDEQLLKRVLEDTGHAT